MKTLTKDARGFVDGVVAYLRREGKDAEYVPKVQRLLRKVTTRAKHERQCEVHSAVRLTASEKRALAQVLSRCVDRPVEITYHIDRSLLAGLWIRLGDLVIDTSLAAQIGKLSETITHSL